MGVVMVNLGHRVLISETETSGDFRGGLVHSLVKVPFMSFNEEINPSKIPILIKLTFGRNYS